MIGRQGDNTADIKKRQSEYRRFSSPAIYRVYLIANNLINV